MSRKKKNALPADGKPPVPAPEFLLDANGAEIRVGDHVRRTGWSSLGARIVQVTALTQRCCVVCYAEEYEVDAFVGGKSKQKFYVPPVFLASLLVRVGGPDYAGPWFHEELAAAASDTNVVAFPVASNTFENEGNPEC
jgi:hypothetical protein